MKWVKVAIGAVIAILSIGIIATSVYGMTQETLKEKVVTFEIVTFSDFSGTTDIDVYTLIDNYSVLEGNNVINVKSIKVNNNDEGSIIQLQDDNYAIFGGNYSIVIKPENVIQVDGTPTPVEVNDVWAITFEVTQPPQLSGVSLTLILLIPLIFTGGVLAYLLNKQEF